MKKQKTSEEPVCKPVATEEHDSDALSQEAKSISTVSMRFGIITLIMAIAGIILSVDSLVRLKEWNSGLQTFQNQIDNRLKIEQKHLDTLESALKNIDTRQKKLDKQLSYYQSAILPILKKKQPLDTLWQLQKVYNWLQQAELDLHWSNDLSGALLLLKAANNVLAEINIPQLDNLHTTITEDITQLSAVKQPDDTRLFNTLSTISDEIAFLPKPPSSEKAESTAPSADASAKSGWRATLNHVWVFIKNLVVITPNDSPNHSESPLSIAHSKKVLNENLSIALQQVQWAVLKNDNVLYHWSINRVIQLIQKNPQLIDQNSPKTIECLDHLNALNQENLAPTVPNLKPVCHELKTYLNVFTQTATETAAVEKTA